MDQKGEVIEMVKPPEKNNYAGAPGLLYGQMMRKTDIWGERYGRKKENQNADHMIRPVAYIHTDFPTKFGI